MNADERVPSSSSTGEYSSDSEFTFNETEEIEMLAMEIRKNGQSRTPWQRTLFTLRGTCCLALSVVLLLLATAGVLHSPIEREAFEEAKHSAIRNPTWLPSAHSKPERIIHGVNRTTIMMPEFIFVDASPSKSLRSALRRAVEAGCTQRWPTLRTGGASRATRVRISTRTTTNLGRDANSYDVDLHWNLASLRRGAVDAEMLRRLLNRTQIDGVWDVSALQANVLTSCIHRLVRWVPLASGDLNAVRAAPASEPWLVSRSAQREPLCDALGDLISPLRGALHSSGGSRSTEGSAIACEPAMLALVLKLAGPAAAVEAKRNGGRESHQQAALGHDSSGLQSEADASGSTQPAAAYRVARQQQQRERRK